jgi:L-aminopeptidase/D-esterase-like protein
MAASSRARAPSQTPANSSTALGKYLKDFRCDGFHTAPNTTLAVVATNACLDKQGACKVAALAQQGLVRVIEPVHTTFDGDMVIARWPTAKWRLT